MNSSRPRLTDTIALVHGGGSSAKEMLPLAMALKPYANSISFNTLGHGGRSIPDDGYTINDIADDLANKIIRADIGRPFVWGYCFGALVTLNMFARYPTIGKGAILLAPRFRYEGDALRHVQYIVSEERFSRPGSRRPGQYLSHHGPDWPKVALNQRRLFKGFETSVPVTPDMIRSIRCPVMVMGPTEDPLTTQEEAIDLVNLLPQSELVIIKGSAHPLTSAPLEKLANLAARFCHRAAETA